MSSKVHWAEYEKNVTLLLNKLQIFPEVTELQEKIKVRGQKTKLLWEIDAIAFLQSGEFWIIECRQLSSSRIKQEHVAAIAYRKCDLGAIGAITASPQPLQRGARIIAETENLKHIVLEKESTSERYILKFLNDVFIKRSESLGIGIFERAYIKVIQEKPKK